MELGLSLSISFTFSSHILTWWQCFIKGWKSAWRLVLSFTEKYVQFYKWPHGPRLNLNFLQALKLSKTSLGETTVGQLVNLLSNDVNRFDSAINLLHYLWIAPVQTAIVTYFMFQVMGWSSFIGVLFLLLLIPLQSKKKLRLENILFIFVIYLSNLTLQFSLVYMGKKMSEFRLKTALRTDERVRLMNEIITGIQVIKMYTWETPFSKLVALARR